MKHHDVFKYKTPSEWYEAARAEGYRIPAILIFYLNRFMEKTKCSFPFAYHKFRELGVFIEDHTSLAKQFNLGEGLAVNGMALSKIDEILKSMKDDR